MAEWVLFCLITTWIWILSNGADGNYLAYDCYGNVLSLSCRAGHRIKVVDDFFGFSPRELGEEDQCRYKKGDCTVTNGRFTSVIHRYCEGKQTCTNFQVDRRFCGTNQTNYEQVEYQCIPDADVTSFCDMAAYSAMEGYLSTPGFPGEYPPDQHCRCSLTASRADVRIRLEATHFIVKFDHPCKDWLEIAVGRHRRRLCGAYRSTLRSQAFNLTFHSDESHGHQGIWLHFSLSPDVENATIVVRCSPLSDVTTTTNMITPTSEEYTSTTEAMTSPSEMETSSTTGATPEQTSTVPSNVGSFPGEFGPTGLTSEEPTTQLSGPGDKSQANESEDPPGGDVLRASRLLPHQTTSTTFTSSTITSLATDPLANLSWSSIETVHASATPAYTVSESTVTETVTTAASSPTVILSSADTVTADTTPSSTGVVSTTKSKGKVQNVGYDREKAHNEKVANMRKGIIIISICVGGIILLIVILSVLLCINKRRQPKRQAEKERKKRLQQRLNSLSFYDSIPLYDSIGRKTGAAVADKANENVAVPANVPNAGKDVGSTATTAPAIDSGSGRQILDPKSLDWTDPKEPEKDEGEAAGAAGWSPGSGVEESDHDSTIYSEIGKSTVPAAKTPPVPARSLPNGEGPPGYSLHLGSLDKNEDIYTHV